MADHHPEDQWLGRASAFGPHRAPRDPLGLSRSHRDRCTDRLSRCSSRERESGRWERESGWLKHDSARSALRVRGLERVALRADLDDPPKLARALSRARAVPLAPTTFRSSSPGPTTAAARLRLSDAEPSAWAKDLRRYGVTRSRSLCSRAAMRRNVATTEAVLLAMGSSPALHWGSRERRRADPTGDTASLILDGWFR
jgi:hypothetical protein